jgi:peptidoglycan/LPS O-acetylase OafA/YrhL
VRRNKPWFGPNPITRNPFFPLSWEGRVVMVAFVLGIMLLQLEGDLTRRGIAMVLLFAAFCAVFVLTWGDPDSDGSPGWRKTFWNRQTLVWLGVLLVLCVAVAAASYHAQLCPGCNHRPDGKPRLPGAERRFR